MLDGDLVKGDHVHTFVNVLFSLEFALDDVLAEARHLEAPCAALEHGFLRFHDTPIHTQWKILTASAMAPDPPLPCCFANELDMELFFE